MSQIQEGLHKFKNLSPQDQLDILVTLNHIELRRVEGREYSSQEVEKILRNKGDLYSIAWCCYEAAQQGVHFKD